MLNVGKLENGIVLDHIQAGRGMLIYQALGLDQKDCSVAIIQNAKSSKMGRKDIIKIEDTYDGVNFDQLAYIDPDLTINVIRNGELIEKRKINTPEKLVDVLKCQNPSCITTIEQGLHQIFVLSKDEVSGTGKHNVYRCAWCEQRYHVGR